MKFDLPDSNFVPHTAGVFTGTIPAVTDQGERESHFEGKTRLVHKITIEITSDNATMDNGEPFIHKEWCTLSNDDRSKLVKLRQALLGRPLTEAEGESFDADAEMIGRRVNYVIEHTYRNGKTYASIASWSLWVGKDADPGAAPAALTGGKRDDGPDEAGATHTPEVESTLAESDLAF